MMSMQHILNDTAFVSVFKMRDWTAKNHDDHGGTIGCGFCKYDMTTADTDNLQQQIKQQ